MPPVKKTLIEPENEIVEKLDVSTQKPVPPKRKLPRVFLFTGIALIAVIIVSSLLVLPVALSLKNSVTQVQTNLSALNAAISAKDLPLVSQRITQTKSSVESVKKDFSKLFWLKPFPFVGVYVSDAQSGSKAAEAGVEAAEIVVKTIEPYSDILGLKGAGGALDGAKTAQDRITFVVETIDKITPQLDQIGEKLSLASAELNKINPDRYPEEFRGTKVRAPLREAQQLLSQAATITKDAKPFLESAPYILGIDGKRTYLTIFQNDAELRPTGGFMTAYAILEVQKGKVRPLFSDDIYALDAKYNPSLRAPDALIKYISFPYQKDPRWRLRDMNMSSDFKLAMDTFLPEYRKTGSPKVDGVISVDTQVLLELLKVIGRIGVPGQGNFSAENDPRCNCPVVIYELESVISVETPYIRTHRKAILGPLMNSILANAVAQPKEKIAELFQVIIKSIQEKHVMMYFTDPNVQASVESFNLAGRVRETEGDYLYVVGSNLAGAKSNLYVKTDVEDTVTVGSDGAAEHELIVNYNNPQRYDGWLNGENRNWFRVYVPKGSQLVDSTGSEVKMDTYEEMGKTVFSGFITVRPAGGVARFTLRYKTPPVVKDAIYKLMIQKQPGSKNDPYILTINNEEQEFELNSDKEISVNVE
jgi:hypothetical protein